MDFPLYTGLRYLERQTVVELPPAPNSRADDEPYFPDPGLVDAVNVALLLRQPLLLTGEPGTGKTSLAYSVARDLGCKKPLKFETKSTTVASDLFYTYDSLKRFQDANERKESRSALHYLTFNAFGSAILRASREEKVHQLLPEGSLQGGPQQSVVLIDEVDKAPRDFPNDILNELEHMSFRIPELENTFVEADPQYRPVVIITSNSEKDLPDAFLRRCIYYHIPFPTDEELRRIIDARIERISDANDQFLKDALAIFRKLRSPEGQLRKKPATAELIGWLHSLRKIFPDANPLQVPDAVRRTLSNLVKTTDDLSKAKFQIDEWLSQRQKTSL